MTDPRDRSQACDQACEILAEVPPGERAAAEREFLRDHLAGCVACRAYAAFLAEATAAGAEPVPPTAAAAVWPRLAAALPSRSRRPRLSRTVLTLAAALVAMVAVSGWLAIENQQLRTRVSVPAAQPVLVPPERLVTVGELAARLRQLPPDVTVLSREQAERLLRQNRPLAYAIVRGPRLDAALSDGVTAREALALVSRLGPETRLALAPRAGERS